MYIFIKYKFYFLIVIGLIVTVAIYIFYNPVNIEEEFNNKIIDEKPIEVVEEEVIKIKVDVKGEVNNPGVYEFNLNKRVIDAIDKAGGLTKKSDTKNINLSKLLTDEMVIIIYDKDSQKEIEYIEVEVEKECPVCNDACVCECNYPQTTNKISISNASIEELQTLTGIGESKAQDIINYRNDNSFNDIEDLMNVPGIGEATFAKIKDFITL